VTYDGNPHTATVVSTNGVNGETGTTVGSVTLSTTHTAAGSYPSDSWTLTGGANYNDISSTTISNNIGKATASVTANNASKLQGTTLTFAGTEFTTSGLISPDAVTGATLTSSGAASGAAASSYDIVPSAATGSGLGNYTISYVNGTLTVTNPVSSNAAPIASPYTVNRNYGQSIHISVRNILTNYVTDAESDPISLAGYSTPTETNGVNLTVVSNVSNYFINYTNPSTQLDDRFKYWVTDGQGNYATNYVTVHVVDTTLTGTPITGQVTTNTAPGTSFTVKYFGVIRNTYVLQRATNLTFAWVNIATNQMPTNPPVIVIDNFSDLGAPPASAYYRVAWKP
jgi:hypothetical protein